MKWPDENKVAYADLPDKEFVKTREAILRLLPKLFPDGSSKYATLEVLETIIDETVGEIAEIWIKK